MAINILDEFGEKLDCHTCDDKLKEERGHDKQGIVPFYVDGKKVFRCPLMLITPLSWQYLKAFSFYEKGFLPGGGCWTKETNKFIQAMMIIDNTYGKIRSNSLKKARKNARSYS